MMDWAGKRYWIVGASEGLGAAVARKLSALGVHVILSARSEGPLKDLAQTLPGPSTVMPVDITDAKALDAAAEQIGVFDGVVHMAGVYWPMKATDWNPDQANAMADVNFTGAMRLMGVVVPRLLAQGHGHIVLTGSLSGFRGLPGAIGYSASKAGVMALAESMYYDLRKTPVKVQLLNPGFIRTRLTEKNDFSMPFIMDPDDAADIYIAHIASDRFKRSFPTLFSWVFRGSQFLPDWMYFRLFS
ncbi:SDR family NAD(P)-dependent oxidoreductase [Mesobacterium sp. TK19101]|uniref:SDR family NAD(P)-dependent oxidoreductase n=1 Tax=Mesobacterium hydrothermale TaxID=3111907 RepID=A0ABU6HBV8_9RHOB|nr:SDR family NAD(P)-dependent oxidoreductase [Mesobacterium sp. TK19101]MEC3859736.1 SDR family NAD(P)-dependent oxidoreductase [Mesobacterium sp. TK19101]